MNKYELLILKELLFHPNSRFTDLNREKLESYHFNYYIRVLINKKLVKKTESKRYSLSIKGKEIANNLDTDEVKFEKQPKTSVLIICEKMIKNKRNLLISQRLKEPFYGFHGFISGKVRYGETIKESAERELLEETGLKSIPKLRYIIHELVYSKAKKLLEDKIFYVHLASNPEGQMKEDFECGKNSWMTESKFRRLKKKFYDEEYLLDLTLNPPKEFLIEKKFVVDKF